MSQAGILSVEGSDPQIPTSFQTDVGIAIPIANTLEILATTVVAGSTPIETSGSGNTVTIEVQTSQAIAASDPTKIGLSSFDSSSFSVDADGFVMLMGGSGATIQTITTDSGAPPVLPALGNINILGGTGVDITGQGPGDTVTVGITGLNAFTTGSVIFWGGSSFAQDNPNFFWDDTENRLGIGTTTPLDTLHVVGSMELDHVATANDDHAIEIVCDADGFSDVKALDIDYITGAIGAGQDEEAILVNIDETASLGGIIAGYLVLSTSEGLATVNGYETGVNVNPIVQQSGTFGNADNILNKAVDVTALLISGGAGGVTAFVADNDTFTVGDAAKFGEMEVILTTGASGSGIDPLFEYSTGAATFASFGPADGTNQFKNTGAILWDATSLTGWVTAASGRYEIRITRQRNVLATTPVLDEIQIAALTEFKWDKNGDVNINSLTLVVDLAVAYGGTGASSLTDGGIMLGSGTGAVTVTAQPTNGQLLIGSTGTDPVLASLTSTGGSVTITPGAGTINLEVAAGNDAILTLTGNSGGALSPTAGNINTLGTGSITIAGAGSTLTTQLTGLTLNSVLYGLGTATVGLLASGTTGQVLQTNTGAAPTYSTATYPSTVSINSVLYASAANVFSGLAPTNRSILTSTSTGVPAWRAVTDGQFIIGSSSSQPIAANITAGTGISITNGANTITVDSVSGGFAWSDTSGAFSPLAQNGYFITTTATGTLPSAPANGDTIKFFVDTTNILTIQATAGKIIRFGSTVSASGGTAVSTLQGDSVELVYRTTNTCWCAVSGFSGVWNVT